MESSQPPTASLVLTPRTIRQNIKGEVYELVEYYWRDPMGTGDLHDEFLEEVALKTGYNEYRHKNDLPYPDEIEEFRKRLSLSYAKISAILGLGINQYGLYEKGEMPTKSAGRYLKILMDDNSALIACIEKAKSILSDKEYIKAMQSITSAKEDYLAKILFHKRCKENGYAPLKLDRLRAIVIYFLNRIKNVTPSILNKLLFYSDFHVYMMTGMALTGLSYRAEKYGPAPNNWKYLPLLDGVELNETAEGVALTTCSTEDSNILSKSEKIYMDRVIKNLGNKSEEEIRELSRKEIVYLEREGDTNTPISFDYATLLKGVPLGYGFGRILSSGSLFHYTID